MNSLRRWIGTPQFFIVGITGGSLLASFVISAIWFADASGMNRFEPAVESLGLLAGITGVVLERRAGARERRDQALDAVRDELRDDKAILDSPAFTDDGAGGAPRRQIFPTLHVSAVDAALSSAVLSPSRDGGLLTELHGWRDEVAVFNHQLSLAEILAFTTASDAVLRDLHDGLHSPDGPLADIREKVDLLLARMAAAA